MPLPATQFHAQSVMEEALKFPGITNIDMFVFPGLGPLEQLIERMEGTEHSLTLCCHELTCTRTAHAVAKVHARANTRVRVLADARSASKQLSLVPYLQSEGVSVTLVRGGVEFTFCAIDDNVLIGGTMDWTSSETQQEPGRQNWVAGVVGTNGRLPAPFASLIASHWPSGWPQAAPQAPAAAPRASVSVPMGPVRPPAAAAGSASSAARVPMGPARPPAAAAATTTAPAAPAAAAARPASSARKLPLPPSLVMLVREIDRANTSVWLVCEEINTRAIADALIRAHERGTSVRVLTNKAKMSSPVSQAQYLKDHGVDVRNPPHDPKQVLGTALMLDWSRRIHGKENWCEDTDEQWCNVGMQMAGEHP